MDQFKKSITKDKLESELSKILEKYDKSHKGTFNTSDLGTIVRLLELNPTLKDIEELKSKVDPEQKGSFTKIQLLSGLLNHPIKKYTEKETQDIIKIVDSDAEGNIKVETLKKVLMEHGEKFTSEEFEKVIKSLDPKKTGIIKASELAKILK